MENQSEKLVSFVVTCKGRLEHLKQTLPQLMAQQNSEVIVVDSQCPDGTAQWVRENHPHAKLVEIQDDGVFNLSRSRNAGLQATTGKWVFFVDADLLVSSNILSVIVTDLRDDAFYTFAASRGKTSATGSCLVPRVSCLKVGGYDEVICGYGGEDKDFYRRLERGGCHKVILSDDLVEKTIRHSDQERVKYYRTKQFSVSQTVNAVYRLIKAKLSDLNPGAMEDVAKRQKLYDITERAISTAQNKSGQKGSLLIYLLIDEEFIFMAAKVNLSLKIDFEIQ